MKLPKTFAALLFMCVTPFAHAGSRDAESPRQVVLTWEEFTKLWDVAHAPAPAPVAPPVAFILSRAEYSGVIRTHATEIAAQFDFALLDKSAWAQIPFLPASLGLQSAELDGRPASVAQEDGFHTVVIKGEGRHRLNAVFSVPSPADESQAALDFRIARTAITLLTLTMERKGEDIRIEPAQTLISRSQAGATIVRAILPPTENIHVSWKKKELASAVLPPKLFSTSLHLVTIQDAAIRIRTDVTYSILNSGVSEFRLAIPEPAAILQVQGNGVRNWVSSPGKNGNELVVFLDHQAKGSYALTLLTDVPLGANATMALPVIRPLGVERNEGSIAIEGQSNAEISIQGADGLRQVDVKEVPPALWSAATSPLLYGFALTQSAVGLTVSVERHQEIPLLTSTIDYANAVTLLTRDGQRVTRLSYSVRNNLKQFIVMKLPEGEEIWSAFVSGKPVKPSRDKDGRIRIPLEKSFGDANETFTVDITTHKKGKALAFAGKNGLTLPSVDLPISQMFWTLYAPEDLAALRFGGTMENDSGPTGLYSGIVSDAKDRRVIEEWRNEPKEALKKAQDALRNVFSTRAALMDAVSAQAVNSQASMETEAAGVPQPSSFQSHVLPVAFRVPEIGHIYRFRKIMVTSDAPSIDMRYVSGALLSWLRFGLLTVALAALFRFRHAIVAGVFGMKRRLMAELRALERSRGTSVEPQAPLL